MLSLLIGMMETSLICLLYSTTKSFKMPCPDMLTVLPATLTSCHMLAVPSMNHSRCCSPPLESGLGLHQPAQNPGG